MPSLSEFDVYVNGSIVPENGKVVIVGNASEARQLILTARAGAASHDKVVMVETSSLVNMSAVNGNLDATGKFTLVVGPSFGAKGNVSLTINVGDKTKHINVQFT